MVKRGVPEMIINIRLIGTPSEKLKPNQIWAQISHWKSQFKTKDTAF